MIRHGRVLDRFLPLGIWMIVLFFIKQKTAYEMRISDWSSDVCSSDLTQQQIDARGAQGNRADAHAKHARPAKGQHGQRHHARGEGDPPCARAVQIGRGVENPRRAHREHRSEEHTSELQSLMRSSYAVFCLKKKIQTKKHTTQPEK